MKKYLFLGMLMMIPFILSACSGKTTMKFGRDTWDYSYVQVEESSSLMLRGMDEELTEKLFSMLEELSFEKGKKNEDEEERLYRLKIYDVQNEMTTLDIRSETEVAYQGYLYHAKEGTISLEYFEELFCVESPYDTVNQGDEISMRTEQETYEQYTDSINLILENHTEYEASFGMEIRLEILEEGKWYQVFPKEELSWIEIAMILPEKSETQTVASLAAFHGILEVGHYRLVKTVHLYKENLTEAYVVAAEFDVERVEKSTLVDPIKISVPDVVPDSTVCYKPVIYLYPEAETNIKVELELNGKLLVSYPDYPDYPDDPDDPNTSENKDGWMVTAYPDGRIINSEDGLEYSYLFWEADIEASYDMSKGFVVAGSDTKEFLQKTLSNLGLTPREYNEFIVYWLPQMQENPYNLITFQQESYTEAAKLHITPEPDSMLRVFMVYQPLEEWVDLPKQELKAFERSGFSVIEWGGAEING